MIPLFAIAAMASIASPGLRLIVSGVTAEDGGRRIAELTLLNSGTSSARYGFPGTVEATVNVMGVATPVLLRRLDAPADDAVAARGFAQARYAFTLPPGSGEGAAMLSLAGGGGGYAFSVTSPVTPAETVTAAADLPSPSAAAFNPDPPAAKPDRGNAFLGNLSTYTPIYAVYGPGTDSDARIQIGFKYQLFGEAGDVGRGAPWANGIHFGYSQRIFWDLGKKSSPFRNVEYLPELFYLLPSGAIGRGVELGGQVGIRHESNGRDGLDSRSLNTIYVQPIATALLGDYTVSVGPRVWAYVGSLEDNPRIKRYRGNTGLLAEIGKPDSWRLSTTTRVNFASGKGSFDAEASYPLNRLFDTSLNLYVFGQGFVGYGENLFDFDRRATRLRIGVGFVR
jgi:outer membrane phospholipase A